MVHVKHLVTKVVAVVVNILARQHAKAIAEQVVLVVVVAIAIQPVRVLQEVSIKY